MDVRTHYARRRVNESLRSDCIQSTLKFPAKLMIWGAISSKGTSEIQFCEGTMDQFKYIETIKTFLPTARNWYRRRKWIFQQDSAPCHTAKRVKSFMASNVLDVLSWPGNSPDMNPIEHMWALLKNEIYKLNINSISELKVAIKDAWENSDILKKHAKCLISSMPRRVKAILKAKGGITKY